MKGCGIGFMILFIPVTEQIKGCSTHILDTVRLLMLTRSTYYSTSWQTSKMLGFLHNLALVPMECPDREEKLQAQ